LNFSAEERRREEGKEEKMQRMASRAEAALVLRVLRGTIGA
jgi:hypothetical protein